MTIEGSSTWNTAADADRQAPNFYLEIEGLSWRAVAAPVKGAAWTAKTILGIPQLSGGSIDLLEGQATVQTASVPLVDIDGDVTDLVCVDAPGAPLTSLINRLATLYVGFRGMDVADYQPLYAGFIRAHPLSDDALSYTLELDDPLILLRGEIMADATDDEPSTIRGNVVNVFWSLLTGTFDTAHADFPLDTVSTAVASTSSAPTGLGIARSLIDEDLLKAQRDDWHPDDVFEFTFKAPEQGEAFIESEIFRCLQAFRVVRGTGKLGLRFARPAIQDDPTEITENQALELSGWDRDFSQHINKVTYKYEADGDEETAALIATDLDLTDITNTRETREFSVLSRGLKAVPTTELALSQPVADDMIARILDRHKSTPATLTVTCHLERVRVEQGDVVLLTHSQVPDLQTGARGVNKRAMLVVSVAPNFENGQVTFTLLDANYARFGLIHGPVTAAIGDYDSAGDNVRAVYLYISDSSGEIDGSPGYVWA